MQEMILRLRTSQPPAPAAPITIPCVDRQPSSLNVEKSVDREIVLKADEANSGPITVTFNMGSANAIFSAPPKSPVVLQPGASVNFTVKSTPLGITRRAAAPAGVTPGVGHRFGDHPEAHAREFNFTTEPGRCGGGSHSAIHVEC